jgi:hypothetical protein
MNRDQFRLIEAQIQAHCCTGEGWNTVQVAPFIALAAPPRNMTPRTKM